MKRLCAVMLLLLSLWPTGAVAQETEFDALFGIWKFTAQSDAQPYYYVLMYYTQDGTAVQGQFEALGGDAAGRQIWAYYNQQAGAYRLVDRVSAVEVLVWEFDVSGTAASGTCYHQRSGGQTESGFAGVLMGSRDPNYPPAIPANPVPAAGAFNAAQTVTLSWKTSDPDSDAGLTYDLYFGTTTTPPRSMTDLAEASVTLGPLLPATTYYWRVVARDSMQGEAAGPVWSFTTLETIAVEPDPSPDEPSGDNGTCPLSIILDDDQRSLDRLRAFRDEVLAGSPQGRAVIAWYYRNEVAAAALLGRYPALCAAARSVLKAGLPVWPH